MAISTLGYALLGLLAREPQSGYELGRTMKNRIHYFWPARYSQIYPELTKLEAQGLITHETITQQDLPAKKVYELTEAGKNELHAWVTAALEIPIIRDELVLKAHSLWLADPQAALELFHTHEQYHQEQLKLYEQYQQEIQKNMAKNMDITSPAFALYVTLQRGIGYEREYASWCHWVAEQLKQAEAK